MNEQYLHLFTLAGLSPEQAKIYGALLQNQELSASIISRLTGIERTLTYKVLGQLIELKLVSKHEDREKIATFKAEHPSRLVELVEQMKNETENSYKQMQDEIGNIIATYNLTTDKPSIRFIEGVESLHYINKDIISVSKEVKLIRSTLDKKNEDTHLIIKDQIKKQIALGIKKKIIGPLPKGKETNIELQKTKDSERLVDRRILDNFDVPAQIMIYGNKVAITDFKNNIITTIIENESVRETFEKIFDVMFQVGKKL